ncbi:O-acetyltransferase OatA [Abditibacteriota bacterium]|nr:O-acetyltransferase OatA [Abditibacteriota bacterium]
MEKNSATHRIDIDGLRAVAVVAVILHHIKSSILPGGYLGVDMFFVISGFVITQSLSGGTHDSFLDFICGFYNRRAKRLVPALCLCVVTTCIVTLMVVSPNNLLSSATVNSGVASLFGLSNIYFSNQATDYFGSAAELNTFTHTWSLGVEEQFYLVFPFLVWIGGWARKTKHGYRNTLLIVTVTGAMSFACYLCMQRYNPIWAFYAMPTRFWELCVGAITYFFSLRSYKVDDALRPIAKTIHSITKFFLIILLFWHGAGLHQVLATSAVTSLTAVIIYWSHVDSTAYKILTLKPVAFIGVISYSLYLWHWSVLTISRLTIGVTRESIGYLLGLILALATMSYFLIEKPLRRANWKPLKISSLTVGGFSYSILLVASASLVIVFIFVPLHRNKRLYTGVEAKLLKKGVVTLRDNNSFGKYNWTVSECVLSSNDDVGKKIDYDGCTFGDFATGKRHFLVIGNSFSAAEMEMYKIIPKKGLGSVTITSSWGASAVPELKNTTAWSKANDYYWNVVVPGLVEHLQPGDVLLMINDSTGFSPQRQNEAARHDLNELGKGLSRISAEMATHGIYVIYQASNPFMRESGCTPDSAAPQWWSRFGKSPCRYYSRKASLERRRVYYDMLTELHRKYRNFFVLDLFDVFCPGDTCRFYNTEGIYLYRDENSHPSVEASVLARPRLLATIENAIHVPLSTP